MMTNAVFTNLTVVGTSVERVNGRKTWKCRCVCGKDVRVLEYYLKCGKVRSCGCLKSSKFKEIKPGDVFGRLTVLEKSASLHGRSHQKWKCVCACLKQRVVTHHSLTSGRSQSCGCLRNNNRRGFKRPYGASYISGFIARMKGAAVSRNYPFELTNEKIMELITQKCSYCGFFPVNLPVRKGCNGTILHVGIDRFDNSKGYTNENSVSCCSTCNKAKNTMTFEEFKTWIERVYAELLVKPSKSQVVSGEFD